MSDMIAAVSTAMAPSGIGVIRLSGDGCTEAAEKILSPVYGGQFSKAEPRKLLLYDLHDRQNRIIDRILAVRTPGPDSYTGEDTVELQCHGSPAVLAEALANLFEHGARQARPGEFTRRAFLNGRMDLTAAEAVIDLIEAETAEAAANAAGQLGGALRKRLEPVYESLVGIMSHFHAVLDYPDEDIDDFALADYQSLLETQIAVLDGLLATAERGVIVKNGVKAVLLGRPNAGKSSLLNALAGYERVIVTPIPGTTRDTVEEKLRLGSLVLRLTDTAGIRDTEDAVERLGVERSVDAARAADLALLVIDGAAPLTDEDRQAMALARQAGQCICVVTKSDLGRVVPPSALDFETVVSVSSVTGEGLDHLAAAAEQLFASDMPCDGALLTNLRHVTAIRQARASIERTVASFLSGATPDAVLVDLESALDALAELLGKTMREDITDGIFSRFCVGK